MADILRRSIAPVNDAAWKEIDELAKRIIEGNLCGRTVTDYHGPHGWQLDAVGLGRVDIEGKKASGGVKWGLRQALPLIEIRIPFTLVLKELDSIARGAKDPDLDEVEKAAEKAAVFEERAVFNGFKEGWIDGIVPSSPHKPIALGRDAESYQAVVEDAVVTIQKQGIGGPYDLILGTAPYQVLMTGDQRGYPLKKRIEQVIGGGIRWSPALRGGLVISRRGGDYEFTQGQDFSIGYYTHDKEMVELYLTESFTFRPIEPRAAVPLTLKS